MHVFDLFSVEVIELEEYSTPSDALNYDDTDEYAETYDECKLIMYQREIESVLKDDAVDTLSNTSKSAVQDGCMNFYHILEKEDGSLKLKNSDSACKSTKEPVKTLRRGSSYEDTDTCLQAKTQTQRKCIGTGKVETESDYEISSATDGIFSEKPHSKCVANRATFEGGLDNIPESIQKKLGIRIVKSDYSEYYSFKQSRRKNSDICRYRNINLCDKVLENSEQSVFKVNTDDTEQDSFEQPSDDDINDYDKLCHFVKTDTRRLDRYDRTDFIIKANTATTNEANVTKSHTRSKSM